MEKEREEMVMLMFMAGMIFGGGGLWLWKKYASVELIAIKKDLNKIYDKLDQVLYKTKNGSIPASMPGSGGVSSSSINATNEPIAPVVSCRADSIANGIAASSPSGTNNGCKP